MQIKTKINLLWQVDEKFQSPSIFVYKPKIKVKKWFQRLKNKEQKVPNVNKKFQKEIVFHYPSIFKFIPNITLFQIK